MTNVLEKTDKNRRSGKVKLQNQAVNIKLLLKKTTLLEIKSLQYMNDNYPYGYKISSLKGKAIIAK